MTPHAEAGRGFQVAGCVGSVRRFERSHVSRSAFRVASPELTDDSGITRSFASYPTGAFRRSIPGGGSRTFDAAYDADGERAVSEDAGLLGSLSGNAKGGVRVTLRGLDAKVRRELLAWHDAGAWRWEWSRDTVYRDGQLLAAMSSNPSAIVRHYSLDHLGTPRLLTDASGAVASQHTTFPYGEEATNPFPDNAKQLQETHRFTGHERDLVDLASVMDDLDYMHARYYSPGVGRFLSVDPARDHGPENAQSWNKYSYGRANPQRFVDREGTFVAPALPGETPEQAHARATSLVMSVGPSPLAAAPIAVRAGSALLPRLAGMASRLPVFRSLLARPLGSFYVRRAAAILKPSGEAVGEAGTSKTIRFVQGGLEAANKMFTDLTAGLKTTAHKVGEIAELPGGLGTVSMRNVSATPGVAATIDVNIEGLGITKVKFLVKVTE